MDTRGVFRFPVIFLVLALVLAGCQTTDFGQLINPGGDTETASLPAGAEAEKRISLPFYTPFYDEGDHLKELIAKDKKFNDAGTLYLEQKEFFAANRAKHQPLLDLLAQGLNAPKIPALVEAKAQLNSLKWPATAGEWPKTREILRSAQSTLEDYPDHDILREPEFKAAEAGDLEKTLTEMNQKIKADGPSQFKAYDHFGKESFFSVYPIDLDDSTFMFANYAAIEPELAQATTGQIKSFAASYTKNVVGAERWSRLGDQYIAASLRESGADKDTGLASVLGAINGAKQAGFTPKKVPGLKIAFVEVTSKTLLKQGQIDFEASVDVDLPVETVKADLDEALSDPTTKGADLLIVFDVALAKASRRVLGLQKIPSTVLTGYRTENNPNYNIVQNEVNNARLKVNQASMSAASANAQYCYGVGCLGKALAQIAHAAAQGAANKSLEEAMTKLTNTPQTLDKPIHSKYHFDKATIIARKAMTVNYYVIDQRKKTYFKSTFDVNEEERFHVAYRIQEEDTKKSAHQQEYDTEKDVDEFEKEASVIKLSQLINHYLGNPKKTKKLASLESIRKDMLKDKNKALANFKANTFDARPLNDPRFDSVVAVYRGDGALGSGFFVKPDIVLTNWHVVEEFKFVEMKMYDGQETFGKVLGKDVRLDLALVKVQSRGKPVRFYTKKRIDLGATTEAIGHPKRLEFSITRGIISAIRNHASINMPKGSGDKVLYIQTDTAINNGNSGGPLFLGDHVIGVNTWGKSKSIAEGLSFSVHYSEVLNFLKEHLPGFIVLKN